MPTGWSERALRVHDGLVIAGTAVVRPWYAVTPFTPADIGPNRRARSTGAMDAHLAARFPSRALRYTASGRDAIAQALAALHLGADDCVTVLTTTGNHYVSACVTAEIERVCRWSREQTAATRALLVVHEFGHPYESLAELRRFGVPIIEDCAYSFMSQNAARNVGAIGDFIVFSFPKFFAVQFGGALLARDAAAIGPMLPPDAEAALKGALDRQVAQIPEIAARRHANARRLAELLAPAGCVPHFPTQPCVVPGVFLFSAPLGVDLPALKRALYAAGIECSVFYGRQAFFIPVHQALSEDDLAYVAAVVTDALGSCTGTSS